MKTIVLSIIISLFAASPKSKAQNVSIPTSYYSAATVNGIINQPECAAIRIYPVYVKNQGFSTMIVGISSSGKELYSRNHSHTHYLVFDGDSRNGTDGNPRNPREAKSLVKAYAENNALFVSEVSLQQISSLLQRGSNGIAIKYRAGDEDNFWVSSFSNNPQPTTTGEALAGDPCPNACGQPESYLYAPSQR